MDSYFGIIARRTIQTSRREKCRVIIDSWIQEDVWWRSTHFGGRTFHRKFKEENTQRARSQRNPCHPSRQDMWWEINTSLIWK
jgi:hypothetical protein